MKDDIAETYRIMERKVISHTPPQTLILLVFPEILVSERRDKLNRY